MDRIREFLNALKQHGLAQGNLLGLLHVLIGRRITLADGTLVSNGLTWRALAAALKQLRWDPETVRDLGLDPADLPPRDRQRFWYVAISQAGVDSPAAVAAGDQLAQVVVAIGYVVGPAPGAGGTAAGPTP
jgi:hypothetical protein